MESYPLPPWLSPSAAQGYGQLAGEASRSALSADLQREEMSQRATQFAIEAQQRSQQTAAEMAARQQQLQYEHTLEQQKIAQDQAYKQQQISLDTAAQNLAQDKFNATTQATANKALAVGKAQRATLPVDQGGEGLTTTQAYLKYVAPYMTGTEIGRLAAVPPNFKPGNTYAIPNSRESLVQVAPNRWEKYATIPESATTAPAPIAVPGEDGNVIGHWVIPPGGGTPHWQPIKPDTTGDQMLKDRMAQKGVTQGNTAAPPADFGPQMVPPPPVRPLLKPSTAVDSGTPDLSQVTILPDKKEDLKEGTLYFTSRGPAVWNGTNFVKQ